MEVRFSKAQYRPGELVRLQAVPPEGTVEIATTVWELHRELFTIRTGPGEAITWSTDPDRVWVAYGVQCRALGPSGEELDVAETAIDAADHWYRSPRLGFMTDFAASETLTETQRRIDLLKSLHINCLHFYDWFYTHHSYLPPEENFVDSMGRELSMIVVRRKVRLAQRAGMATLAYGPLYGAEESFVVTHPDWAFYRSDGVPFHVARLFYIMDFRAESPWTAHILAEYSRAVTEIGFDGIQIDQYGYPKRALTYPGELGQPSIDLSDLFLPFIELAQAAIEKARPGSRVIFHAVNNWPLQKAAAGPQVANSIQVFPPHETYRDLRDLVVGARTLAPEKPVILAAYLKAFGTDTPERSAASLRLLTAVIQVSGGYHASFGEGEGVLTEGYYPNYARLEPVTLDVLRRYADFAVRYGPLLHAPVETDVSETHGGGLTHVYAFAGVPTSPIPRPGAVWTAIREHGDLITINLVNLTRTETGRWSEGQPPPDPVEGVEVLCRVLEPIDGVYAASPDGDSGTPLPLPYAVEPDPGTGHQLRFRLPPLHFWVLVIIVPQSRN